MTAGVLEDDFVQMNEEEGSDGVGVVQDDGATSRDTQMGGGVNPGIESDEPRLVIDSRPVARKPAPRANLVVRFQLT